MKKIESTSEMSARDFPCHGDLYATKRLIGAAFKVWSLKRGIDPQNYYEGPNWFKYKRACKARNNNDQMTWDSHREGRHSLLPNLGKSDGKEAGAIAGGVATAGGQT
jgi:hypothetical protein